MIKQCQRCGADYDTKQPKTAKWCPACRVIREKERHHQDYLDNKAKYNAKSAKWRQEHLEESRAISRKHYALHSEKARAATERWKKNNPEKFRQCLDEYNAKKRKKRKIERQKNKLRAKLQAAAAKRQAQREYHDKLYNPPSMFDGIGVHIPSQLANLGMP